MRRLRPFPATAAVALALVGGAGIVLAQSPPTDTIETNAPDDASGSYQVDGVQVDATGPSAEAARFAGWRLAQRKAYQMLAAKMGAGGGVPSDATLDQMVTGIVIENEQIGPNRYIARLGVLFSRGRIAGLIGGGGGLRSSPMVLVPVMYSGGAGLAFEQDNPWNQAWGRFRAGDSTVDYVRTNGTGPDALLMNVGQSQRRDRGWWRSALDHYAAADVLTAVVVLSRQWPGGPVIGSFEARHGPDNHLLGRFSLSVGNEDGVPALFDAGVKRIDAIYQDSLANGSLTLDPSLAWVPPPMATPTPTPTPTDLPSDGATISATGATTLTVQFDTPTAAAVSSTETTIRGLPGASGVSTTSLAIGGVSVMRLDYAGDPDALRAALQARGFSVARSGTTLRIRRAQLPPPNVPSDDAPAG